MELRHDFHSLYHRHPTVSLFGLAINLITGQIPSEEENFINYQAFGKQK
jgi:hypothetical protein